MLSNLRMTVTRGNCDNGDVDYKDDDDCDYNDDDGDHNDDDCDP